MSKSTLRKILEPGWLLMIASLSLGQLGRISLSGGWAVYSHELILIHWIGLILILEPSLLARMKIWLKQRAVQMLIGYWLILVLLAIGKSNWLWLGYQLRILLYLFFGSILLSPKKVLSKANLVFGLLILGFVLLATSWWQYWQLPDLRFLAVLGWDDHYYRLTGLTFDPNFTGVILGLMSIFWWRLSRRLSRPVFLIGFSLLLISLLATYSRASYLAFAISAAYLWLSSRKFSLRHLLIVAIIGLSAWWLFPKPTGEGINLLRTQSITARWTSDRLVLNQLSFSNWLIGSGWQTASTNTTAKLPNNLFVTLISGWGIIGASLLFWLLVVNRIDKKLNTWQKAAWILVLIHAQFNNSLIQPLVLPTLLLTSAALNLQLEKNSVFKLGLIAGFIDYLKS